MDYLTHEKFKALSTNDYWKNGQYRWDYMSKAIELMQEIDPVRVCEAGTSGIPLCSDSVLLEYPYYDLNFANYPFDSKHFDVFVALQVWEHLKKPAEAFAEARRISKNVILSIPYQWKQGDAQHVGLDDSTVLGWTRGEEPCKTIHICRRKIYLWRCE